MELTDYQQVISLWQTSQGVKLRDADSIEGIKNLLKNQNLSFVATKVDIHSNNKRTNNSQN
ncbi:hypothetical protein [Marinicellulosiphila megalodicopiae]|uniref:hypothetical protein n=1 Tax=Marinicellulosiphila megalodicopiae TaxID=2724896 RepID=UPI003BB1975B